MARAPAEVSDFRGQVGTGKPIVVPCTQSKQVPQGTGPHPGHPLATRGVLLSAMEVHQGG